MGGIIRTIFMAILSLLVRPAVLVMVGYVGLRKTVGWALRAHAVTCVSGITYGKVSLARYATDGEAASLVVSSDESRQQVQG